jgi:hypothetical protein
MPQQPYQAQPHHRNPPQHTLCRCLLPETCNPPTQPTISPHCCPAGSSLLPFAQAYAAAALSSPHQRLRLLGVNQLGRLLLLAGGEGRGAEQLQVLLVIALKVCVCGGGGRGGMQLGHELQVLLVNAGV